jgi:hypothetical protein
MYTTCKLFVNYEVAKAIGRKLSDIHHPMYLLFFVCDVNDVVNIIMVKVGEVRCIAEYSLNVLRMKFFGAECENNFVGTR